MKGFIKRHKSKFEDDDGSNVSCYDRVKEILADVCTLDYATRVWSEIPTDIYYFSKVHITTLNYPNRLEKIKFNNSLILKFDTNAKLPCYEVVYFVVYKCEHNYPVLIGFSGLFERTYYSPDKKTGLWVNEKLGNILTPFLKGIEKKDENGVRRYVVKTQIQDRTWNKGLFKKWRSLTRNLCKNHSSQIYIDERTFQLTFEWLKAEPLAETCV